MYDGHPRKIDDLPSAVPEPSTPVSVLPVHEKPFVQGAHFFQGGPGNQETWPGSGEPGPNFGEYALAYDFEKKEFPERFRVLDPGELPVNFDDRDSWTGSIQKADLDALIENLRGKYPPPRHLVLTMYGDDWDMAALKFIDIFNKEE